LAYRFFLGVAWVVVVAVAAGVVVVLGAAGWVVVVLSAAAVLFTSGKSAQKHFWVDPEL
jgi:hypothetical protein